MKKQTTVVVLLLLLISAAGVQAQSGGVKFGVRAGLNVATWGGEAVENAGSLLNLSNGQLNQSTRQGFHAGGFANIPVAGNRLEIEPGLYYSQKGTRITGRVANENVPLLAGNLRASNRAEYIEMPVLARLYLTEGFHIFAGPQVSYLISNNVRTDVSVLGFSALNQNLNTYDTMQKFDFAAAGGVGYQFTNGLNLGAGYDFGFNRVDEGNNFRAFNRAFKFSVGYQF
jgi:hypothetical protein